MSILNRQTFIHHRTFSIHQIRSVELAPPGRLLSHWTKLCHSPFADLLPEQVRNSQETFVRVYRRDKCRLEMLYSMLLKVVPLDTYEPRSDHRSDCT